MPSIQLICAVWRAGVGPAGGGVTQWQTDRQKDRGGGGRRRGLTRVSSVSVIIELQEDTRQQQEVSDL